MTEKFSAVAILKDQQHIVDAFLYARLKTGRIMLWRCSSVYECVRPWSIQFSGLLFAIFGATALKLGLLICSKELQFQFVMPLENRRI
jgi:hypothetical protein